jgi:phage repressor protein C with HTH and peptisase S24 domain
LTHEQIWSALDRLAARAQLSPSGLARRAGLDPTTFNRSKRVTADGRERWPSTESVAKALAAADASIDIFVELMGDGPLDTTPATAIRRGDRAVVKTRDGEVVIGELKRRTAKMLELTATGAAAPGERTFATSDIEWIARIVWVRNEHPG